MPNLKSRKIKTIIKRDDVDRFAKIWNKIFDRYQSVYFVYYAYRAMLFDSLKILKYINDFASTLYYQNILFALTQVVDYHKTSKKNSFNSDKISLQIVFLLKINHFIESKRLNHLILEFVHHN